MKKKITGALVVAIFMITTSFAANPVSTNNKVDQVVLTSFNQRFDQAKEINWIKSTNYYKASFYWNDQYLLAFFNLSGDLVGITRNLNITQVPITLQAALKKNQAGSWITELFEYTTEDETTYYVTFENSDQKVTMKSDGNNTWSLYKKTKKN